MRMKKVYLSIALFTLCFGAFAQSNEDGCIQCGVNLRGQPANTSNMEEISIRLLADQICNAMIIYDTTGTGALHEAFELVILNHLNIDKNNNPNYWVNIRNFWNQHHEQMVCQSEAPGYDSPQHILKRVVEMGDASNFYFGYFLADRQVNVNAIEMRNGQPETVVDYLDTILEDPQSNLVYDLNEVRRLRSILVELMGARRAREIRNT